MISSDTFEDDSVVIGFHALVSARKQDKSETIEFWRDAEAAPTALCGS
jgi:hypothetical protein